MNFTLLSWHRLPSHLDFTSLVLLALLFSTLPVARADGVKPMRSGSAKNSAQAEALAPADVDVVGATRPARAREGQQFLPPSGSFGVKTAGVVRGNGAGNLFRLQKPVSVCVSPVRGFALPHGVGAQQFNQEARRV